RRARGVAEAGGRTAPVFSCPHAEGENSPCRKPKPGLLEEIGRRFNTLPKDVPAIGDSLRDLQAAAAVAAQPILVLTGKGAKTQGEGGLPPGTRIYPDLAAAVKFITK